MFDAKALAKFDIPIYDAGLTWEAIASVASQWNEDRAFFSIPADESENWNCLFLEVFYSLFDKDAFLTKKVTFEKLLCSEVNAEGYKLRDEVFTASLIFNKLLYGHSKKLARWRTTAAVNKYDVAIPNAVVSRQWFTTLQQTVSQFTSQSFGVYRGAGNAAEASKNGAQENAPESIENYLIRRLPGGFTCSGEWYLGILRKSVATNFGERFLEFIGSVESDRDRVRLGVGLSVLEQKRTPLTDRATSICVGVDSFEALPNDCSFIERSRISEYRSWTAIMAQTLRSIAKIDPSSKPESHVEFAWKTFLGTINSDSCK